MAIVSVPWAPGSYPPLGSVPPVATNTPTDLAILATSTIEVRKPTNVGSMWARYELIFPTESRAGSVLTNITWTWWRSASSRRLMADAMLDNTIGQISGQSV